MFTIFINATFLPYSKSIVLGSYPDTYEASLLVNVAYKAILFAVTDNSYDVVNLSKPPIESAIKSFDNNAYFEALPPVI